MSKQRDIDVEIRRFKNRVRQRRCRARKREDKSKTDAYVLNGDHNVYRGERSLPLDLFISRSPSMTNGLHTVGAYLDAETHQANIMGGQQCGANECEEKLKSFADFGDGCIKEIDEKGRIKFAVLGLPCMINSFPRSECTSILNDVMARRLKNRERQRRYRARKRQEVDTNNAYMRNQSTCLQIQQQSSEVVFKLERSVRCHRDWKKDARMAYHFKESTDASLGVSVPAHDTHLQIKAQPGELYSENRVNPIDYEATPGRRNWKTAARNKCQCTNIPGI